MNAEPVNDIFVARQPIFDPKQNVLAYELLYRSSMKNTYDATDATSATLDVMRNAFLMLGPQLIGTKKAFINFNRDLLNKRSAFSLRPESTVIEILEDVEVDDSIVAACRELKGAGYVLALDDFDQKNRSTEALISLADIIKVDFRSTTPEQRKAIVASNKNKKIQFLAEKVETIEEFEEAREMGYVYFQGYFFGKPVIVSAKNIPGSKLNYVRMLSEINQPELDFRNLEKIIMQDTYFTYTLLNYMNSAYFSFRDHVTSIRQALVFLGERELRKWASLIILTFIGVDRPSQVVVTSLVRAKFCEALTHKTDLADNGSELFMMGMLSLLDVLVGRPLAEILETMNVSKEVKIGLKGGNNRHGQLFRLVLAYEKADWQDVDLWAGKLSLDVSGISEAYRRSVEWADQVFEVQPRTMPVN
ncbi:MAG: putative cyclic-di-GMP phosphodiesterase AdrB [Syntrophorhabdaceae bacterium PtaU1.Bin034]|nr:MAG: putative cyclic-di-GMP phosphodiesterase AdrB [Syntrophorhabdaceae bacterium PtaU1.Bin034]